ncbi:hypothetical protein Leryth_013674 [Lithospermum erythrorhizon]|uniref:Polysaccharide biosynthesis domain-containing protein n=1 Tax=Lithospermum erythrorhizon TaxID=34254 RepID=A0AAV3QV35_LITER|nr:hypothetical protein Leryth_013674 [Lithospermum erythrorhizon]
MSIPLQLPLFSGRLLTTMAGQSLSKKTEEKYPEIETYDVQYLTKLSDTKELIKSVKDQLHNECRPVQNLFFSECKLGLNDLPNQLYELDWDVILIDGPRGYWPEAPGRTAAIFTSSVLARSKKGGNTKTHVFVHDFNMEVDRVTSDEFLCKENLIKSKEMLGHFDLERMEASSTQFCHNQSNHSSSPRANSSS